LVVGRRFADDFFAPVDFFAADFFAVEVFPAAVFAVDRFACAPARAFEVPAPFFAVAAFVPVVAAAPDDTRVECFVRCRTFFGAASTLEASVNAASSATSNIFIVVRAINRSSGALR
jgi:hypothetical protein